MKRISSPLCLGLALLLTACSGQVSQASPAPTQTAPPGQTQLISLFQERYDIAFPLAQAYFTCCGCGEDAGGDLTGEDGSIWRPCPDFNSVAQLKAATLDVFTQAEAAAFFQAAFDKDPPVYREEKGVLYQRQFSLPTRSPWLSDTVAWDGQEAGILRWDTLTAEKEEENKVTYTIGCRYWYDPVTVRFVLLRGADGVWRFDTCFEPTEPRVTDSDFKLSFGQEGTLFGVGDNAACPLGRPERAEQGDFIIAHGEGDFGLREYYDGLTVTRYYNNAMKTGYVLKLETTRTDVAAFRGVRVGDGRGAVLAAYPDITPTDGDSFLALEEFPGGPGKHLEFYFENDTVVKIICYSATE